jgi:hypothetical protein
MNQFPAPARTFGEIFVVDETGFDERTRHAESFAPAFRIDDPVSMLFVPLNHLLIMISRAVIHRATPDHPRYRQSRPCLP